ncbi:uncharacterized protein LOC131250790 isoform X4 [Magnolia sinica]|uniref:uncharacterized protein LOC131250790 isoform X4 n=1 Tax=Magnolia sinica TaxID=86752 RepID=UPI002659C72C|nr:uncharacterized protein LOC131250790 isoform X4 [Magnolia sinica]
MGLGVRSHISGFIMQDILPEELQTATKTLELPISMPATQHDSYDNGDGDDLWCEDGSFYIVSDDGSGKTSDLDREWERRHNQFHTCISSASRSFERKDGRRTRNEREASELV